MNSSNRWMTINSDGQKVTDPGELAALNVGKTVAAYHDAQQGDNYIHSWAVEDASYLKLSNVTLGYTFPKNLIARDLRFPNFQTTQRMEVTQITNTRRSSVSNKENIMFPSVQQPVLTRGLLHRHMTMQKTSSTQESPGAIH